MSSRFEVTAPAEADSFEEQKLGTFKSARHLGLTLLHAAKSTLRPSRYDTTYLSKSWNFMNCRFVCEKINIRRRSDTFKRCSCLNTGNRYM